MTRHRHSHHRPEIVFGVEEANPQLFSPGQAAHPAEDIVFGVEEAQAGMAAADTAQHDALANVANSRISDGVNGLGAVNDGLNAVNGYLSAPSEVLPSGYRGPFLPRTANVAGSNLRTAPQPRAPGVPISDRSMGALGVVAGGAQAINSFRAGLDPKASHEDRVQAAFGVGVGSLGAAGGVATTAGMTNTAGGLGILAGALEAAQGIRSFFRDESTIDQQAAGAQQALHGGLAAAGSVASLAGATTAAPVIAAGTAGVSAGTALQQHADAVSLEQGRYTENIVGRGADGQRGQRHISASDDAARQGAQDGELMRDAMYSLTGSSRVAGAAGHVSGFINTGVHSIGNAISNFW